MEGERIIFVRDQNGYYIPEIGVQEDDSKGKITDQKATKKGQKPNINHKGKSKKSRPERRHGR